MSLPMTLAAWIGGVLLLLGAAGAVHRIARGPSLLDRAVATDVLMVVLSSGLLLDMAVRRTTENIVLVVLAAAVGFMGSVMVSRFVEDRRPDHPQEPGAHVPHTTDVPHGGEGQA